MDEAATPDGRGTWSLLSNGRVVINGIGQHYGDLQRVRLNAPVVDLAPTRTGRGYWILAADGGVFSFGDATFHGSTGSMRLNEPVVGMAPDGDGSGYWLVAADGGIFAFDAPFHGSIPGALKPGQQLNKPIIGMVPSRTGGGYLLVASDGGVFAFGDAPFFGSNGGTKIDSDVVDLDLTATGAGYAMVTESGKVSVFGDAKHVGEVTDSHRRFYGEIRARSIVLSPVPGEDGYRITQRSGGSIIFGDYPGWGRPHRAEADACTWARLQLGRLRSLAGTDDVRVAPYEDRTRLCQLTDGSGRSLGFVLLDHWVPGSPLQPDGDQLGIGTFMSKGTVASLGGWAMAEDYHRRPHPNGQGHWTTAVSAYIVIKGHGPELSAMKEALRDALAFAATLPSQWIPPFTPLDW